MTLYLQMDGVDDLLNTPLFANDEIVIDMKSRANASTYLVNAVSGTFNLRRSSNGTYSFTGFAVQVNGSSVTSGTTFLTQDTRATIRLTRTSASTQFRFFTQTTTAGFAAGDIYDIKLYNAGVLVAHYDMSTGNVQDITGNGNNATLTGGTWIDDGAGGTPTTQDGTASIIGTGTLSATATKIQNSLVSMLGTGTLTASSVIIKNGQTSIVGQGLLVANADTLSSVIMIDGSANLKGSGLLTVSGITLKNSSATLQGQGILTANADTIHTPTTIDGVFTALGTGFLTVEGEIIEFIEPEAPAITVDVILELLFDTENKTSLVSEVQTLVQAQSNLENKVSLTFNL